MTESMIEKTLSAEESKTEDEAKNSVSTVAPQASEQGDYEKSVTEKENLLLSSFNKMNLKSNNNNNSMVESNNNINLLLNNQNGKSSIESPNSSPQHHAPDLIMDETNVTTNGHEKNNSIDNVL
jgi:hypothetical protein